MTQKITLILTLGEANHLLGHLQANGQETVTDYGWFYGSREQFEARHEKLKEMLHRAILGILEDRQ